MASNSPRTIIDLRPGDHLCCIFETEEEHQSVVTSFLRQGLEQGEKAIYIVDTHTAETILGYLRDDGMDVQPYLDRGQLVILTGDQTYVQAGVFDPDRMIALLQSETERALAEGYPALRVTGEMSWALRGLPGSEQLIEYEARLNEFFPGSQCLAICQYNRRRFEPAVLLEVLRTHPVAMIGTRVHDNFYYIPPAELLSGDRSAAELHYWLQNLAERKQAHDRRQHLLAQVRRDRQSTEELTRSVERERHTLQTIMENTHAQLAYLDPQFNFIRVNSAYAQGAGYSKEELIGRNHFELFPHAENQAIFERVMETGEPAIFHAKPFVYPDRPELGTTYWDWTLVPVQDRNGDIQGLVFSLLDVTERERAQERTRHQNEFLNSVVESLTHPFYVLDAHDYTIKMANSATRLGSLAENTTCYAMTHRSDRPCEATEHPCPLREVKRTKQPVVVEHVHYNSDGNPRHVEVHSYPILDGEGNVSQVIEYDLDITERKRAEAEIRELARFPDENPYPVLKVSKDGTIMYANDASADLLNTWGRQVDQRLPDPLRRLVPSTLVSRSAKTEVSVGDRVFALTFAPVPEQEYTNVYGLEITGRKRAEEALRRYAQRLQVLYETDQAILSAQSVEEIAGATLHHVSRLVPCVRASVALFDSETGEMSMLAAHADDKTQLGTGWRGPLEWTWFLEELGHGQIHTLEDVQTKSPSSPLVEALQAEGVRGYVNVPLIAHGNLLGSLNLGMDRPGELAPEQVSIVREVADHLAIGIQQASLREQVQRHTDELEARVARRTAALQASEARFRALFEEAALGIALVDMEGQLVTSNPALQGLLGYGDKELRGVDFIEFTHPDDAATIIDLHRELLAGKRDQYKVENRFVRKDGQLVRTNLVVSLIRGTGSRPEFAIGLVEDITERKQAQAALIQAERLSIAGRLAASLSHEINNPLQSVIGCLGLAEETLADGGDVSRYLQVARDELRRAARIVSQLRDMQRQSSPEERVPTDVNALLEHVLTLSRNQCQDRGIEVVWNKSDDLPSLSLVPDRIQQVFLNLILNAIDAMQRDDRLQVSTAHTRQPVGVRVTVTDSGVGITPDVLPHIFDPFSSTKPDGLGLGLFTSQQIVKQHGGRIKVDTKVGEGTTFTVWLPGDPP
jgi:PAS domain S-box-containing protein